MLLIKTAIMCMVLCLASACVNSGDTISDGNPNTTTYVDNTYFQNVQFNFVHQYYHQWSHGHVDCTVKNNSNNLIFIQWQIHVYKNGVLLQSTNAIQNELLPGEAKTFYNILYLTQPLTSYNVVVSVIQYEILPVSSI